MKRSLSARSRLFGAGLLMALAAGCGGGDAGPGAPPPGPPGAPVPPPPAPPEVRGWSKTFGSAAVVIGQAGFDQVDPEGTGATPLPNPLGNSAVSDDGRLFVANNSLLLAFNQFNTANGPVAALTYDMNQAFGTDVSGGVSVQGPRMVVTASHRIHIFPSAPDDQSAEADAVAGTALPGCSNTQLRQPRAAVLTPLGQLVVADTFNHRVLIWNTVPTEGPLGPANLVLGQRDMDHCVANDDDGDGNTDGVTAMTMSSPESVWSDGVRIVVADRSNSRVLIWDTFPTVGDPDSLIPDHVLGQQNFTSAAPNKDGGAPSAASLALPFSIDVSASGELAVVDSGNNRILIWNSIPARDGQEADHVVGQSDFVHGHPNDVDQRGVNGTVPSAKTLSFPTGVRFHGRDLIVTDTGNDRVLIWHESD